MVLYRLYERFYIVFMTGPTTALPSPIQSPIRLSIQTALHCIYKRLCTVSINGSAPSLQTALHCLYDWLYTFSITGSASSLRTVL